MRLHPFEPQLLHRLDRFDTIVLHGDRRGLRRDGQDAWRAFAPAGAVFLDGAGVDDDDDELLDFPLVDQSANESAGAAVGGLDGAQPAVGRESSVREVQLGVLFVIHIDHAVLGPILAAAVVVVVLQTFFGNLSAVGSRRADRS